MKIVIENREFECSSEDTILDVARRNGIRIPTICYLSGCSPTLACKMCMVEVNGKRAYSCNAKVKDGMNVLVNTPEILSDRKEIMTTYCVNHPLECGVCDKSGECELQDFTLHTKVDTQLFGLKEADKKSYSFAQSFYDPALCIMCERCATTCKDNIGESNLKAGKANLFTPDNYKDSMGKDPYSVWAKRQKGLIEFVGANECKDCGECISVCPVGAMTYKDFTYTSNAWELQKVESTCALCPAGCNVIYNVKHLDVKGDVDKVYRVQNDYLYNPICGAGRFVFDNVSLGSRDMGAALEALNRADSIYLGGNVSNEEALLAHLLAKFLDIPLFSYEARLYQSFYGLLDSSAKMDYIATFEDFKNANAFIALHCYFKYDSPLVRYRINNNLKLQKSTQLINISLFKDSLLQGLGKNAVDIIGSAGSISMSGILGLVFANNLIDEFLEEFPNALRYLDDYVVKTKDSSEESSEDSSDKPSFSNAELAVLESLGLADFSSLKLAKKGGILLLSAQSIEDFIDSIAYDSYEIELGQQSIQEAVGTTIAQDIAKGASDSLLDMESRVEIFSRIVNFVCQKLELKTCYIPKDSNTIGIANLCALPSLSLHKSFSPSYCIGIRTSGHFIFDSNLSKSSVKPDFALPSLMQNEGSITNMEVRLLPLNPSVAYLDDNLDDALDFSDVALEILSGIDDSTLEGDLSSVRYIGDLSVLLHKYAFYGSSEKSCLVYRDVRYENLKSRYERDGRDLRGYRLEYRDSSASLANDGVVISQNDIVLKTQNDGASMFLNDTSTVMLSGSETSLQNQDSKENVVLRTESKTSLQNQDFKDSSLNAQNDVMATTRNDIEVKTQNDNFINTKNEGIVKTQNDVVATSQNDLVVNIHSENLATSQKEQETLQNSKLHITFYLKMRKEMQPCNAIKLESQNHFNHETLSSGNLQSKSGIYTSAAYLKELGLKEGDYVSVKGKSGSITSQIYVDYDLQDSILLISPMICEVDQVFDDRFYAMVEIEPCRLESSAM